MKKQPLMKLLIVAVIISAAFFVMSATRTSQVSCKEDCTGEKSCEQKEQKAQSEFFLESLTRMLLSR
jgi:hypothetical protein